MIGALWLDSRRRLGIFLYTTASRTALGPTQPPIQWVPGLFPSTMCRGQRMSGAINPLTQYAFMAWCSVKAQGQIYLFTFTFTFTSASRPAPWPTQPPIQWVPGALSLGLKRPGREANHSLPSNADVKNSWSYSYTHTIRLHGVMLN
jgi:hypothetical protein